jgi:DNA repair protein RecO (recombination protein O)
VSLSDRDRAGGVPEIVRIWIDRGGTIVPAKRSLALVVRTVEVFETSLVVTLLTREMGKVAALAKGGRRLRSSFQGGLDLLGVSDILLLPKASESLDLLTEAAPLERFACLRRDLAALYAGYYVAELLTDLTDYHDPHPRLFDAARITLRHLGDPELRDRRVLRFELACLRELGLMPALDQCAHCGAQVDTRGDVAFALATGGVICPSCRPGEPHVTMLDSGTLETIRVLASPGRAWREPTKEARGSSLQAARQTISAVISHLLGHRPRLWPYLGV